MSLFASLVPVLGIGPPRLRASPMRRPLALLAAVAVFATVPAAAPGSAQQTLAPLPAAATFVINGRGWGHGVGMSQYGAYGYAQHGYTYQEILAHYFPGTDLTTVPKSRVRVLLAVNAAKLKISSAADFTAKDANGVTHQVAAGTYTLTPALKLAVDGAQKPVALAQPVLFQPGAAPLALARRYRGSIQVDLSNGKLRAINVVGLEQYLYGVVPSEMPFQWSPQALDAQAVAARSYALATRRPTGAFDLYPDTRSQVYLGIDHEKPTTTAAVDATSGQVVTYDGAVATTYFFSTSGGKTASAQDVWGKAVPYLVSVPDPYDSISPYHTWGPVALTGAKLGRLLHAGGAVTDAATTLNSSGRVATMNVLTAHGEKSFDANTLRSVLGLRSTWFKVGTLALGTPGAAVSYGSAAQLPGVVRGLADVSLQQRNGTAWQTVGAVSPAKDGTIAVSVKPTATSYYRLSVGKAATAVARVPVAPLVRLTPPRTQTDLRGTVRPILPGVAVAIQLEQGSKWVTVAHTTLTTSGTFDAQLQLADGTYRARVAPGHGLVAGVSSILQVSSS